MGLSKHINDVIENNRESLIKDVSIKHLLYDLRIQKILTDDNVEELENIKVQKKLNDTFIRILLTRQDEDFYKFCKLLQRNQATAIQNIGHKLEQEAHKGNNL